MEEIGASLKRVTKAIGHLATAAAGQSEGPGSVNRSVGELERVAQPNAALVEEGAAAAQRCARC